MKDSEFECKKTLIIIGALPSSIINFRGDLVTELSKKHNVICMANSATKNEVNSINALGASYLDFPVKRNGLNPIEDIKTLKYLYSTFRANKPDIVIAYTIKPVIWGGIAARLAGVKSFNALITGLGFAFQRGGLKRNILTFMVKNLYGLALKNAKSVIFQNTDNKLVFIKNGIIEQKKCYLVNGSGVNLAHFVKCNLPEHPIFLLIARLLREKGVCEYVEAAKIVKRRYPDVNIRLVGPPDPSPDGIKVNQVTSWHDAGIIEYCGSTDDVRRFISDCSVFVLPSYHEGMPRTVLEAMAMGRPILTTHVSGCKETVVNGENGWLVEKANVKQLAEKMIWFIENQEQWREMGQKSHKMAHEKFDVHKVNEEMLKILGLK